VVSHTVHFVRLTPRLALSRIARVTRQNRLTLPFDKPSLTINGLAAQLLGIAVSPSLRFYHHAHFPFPFRMRSGGALTTFTSVVLISAGTTKAQQRTGPLDSPTVFSSRAYRSQSQRTRQQITAEFLASFEGDAYRSRFSARSWLLL
jgi:hypothetical protein